MRKLIAGMKVSVDGKTESSEGMADWVDAWSEDYGLTPQIDACVLGAGMYPGYERYWTGIRNEPATPAWITGAPPTPAEIEWAEFVTRTPHYVLSTTLTADVATLKRQPGKDIYLIGGARTTASLMDAGLVDELRLIVHPLVAGDGKALFASMPRRPLDLRKMEPLGKGRIGLVYGLA
jgi:dihydrofolate reductase